jgi:hypothetical protein
MNWQEMKIPVVPADAACSQENCCVHPLRFVDVKVNCGVLAAFAVLSPQTPTCIKFMYRCWFPGTTIVQVPAACVALTAGAVAHNDVEA